MKKFLILSLLLCFFMTNTPLVFAESLSEKQERIEQQAQEEKNKIQEATDKLNEVSEKMRILQAELDEANTAYNEIKALKDELHLGYETSFSFGVVEIEKGTTLDVNDMLRAADEKMYSFKMANR